jgi:hypothetical protein
MGELSIIVDSLALIATNRRPVIFILQIGIGRRALAMANRPTGPHPKTTTVSPSVISAMFVPKHPERKCRRKARIGDKAPLHGMLKNRAPFDRDWA